jgi:hypothetical protein
MLLYLKKVNHIYSPGIELDLLGEKPAPSDKASNYNVDPLLLIK